MSFSFGKEAGIFTGKKRYPGLDIDKQALTVLIRADDGLGGKLCEAQYGKREGKDEFSHRNQFFLIMYDFVYGPAMQTRKQMNTETASLQDKNTVFT